MEKNKKVMYRYGVIMAAVIGLLQFQTYYVQQLNCTFPSNTYQWIAFAAYFFNWAVPVWIVIRIIL